MSVPQEQRSFTDDKSDNEDVFYDARYPSEEEADLVSKSHASKADANKLFASARYSEAVSTYDHALAFVPTYLDYEVAVLRSNIAACHLKLEDWKGAADAATASLDCLARLDPATAEQKDMNKDKDSKGKTADSNSGSQNHDDDDGVVELDASDEASEASALATLAAADARRTDIQRIRAKSLLRRARARSQLGSWGDLQGSEVDYKQLLEMASGGGGVLPPSDVKEVRRMLAELPGRTAVAREREIGEMMGKLKDLGNGVLKPFGLSTDNFKFVRDEKTGGYSMSFEK